MKMFAQQLIQQLPGGVMLLDRHFKLTYVNDFICQHSGLSEQSLIGRVLFQLFPEVPRDWFCRKASEVLQQQRAQHLSWQQRLYLLKFPRQSVPDAGAMAQNVSLIPLDTAEGHVLAIWLQDATEAARHHAQLLLSNQQLKQQARFDPLTELPNRQFWLYQLQLELARAERYQRPLAVLLFELERFKALNDQYGHQLGDKVLRSLAQQCSELLRDNDLLARLAGAEFAILLPDTELAGALEVASRIKNYVAQLSGSEASLQAKLSISCGISALAPAIAADTLLQQAEQALYQAKCMGKNQTSFWRG